MEGTLLHARMRPMRLDMRVLSMIVLDQVLHPTGRTVVMPLMQPWTPVSNPEAARG